jgi:hypothetical protein
MLHFFINAKPFGVAIKKEKNYLWSLSVTII